MTALTRAELALLDFLCGAHHERCRVTRLRYPWSVQAENLQKAGLVEPDSYAPTAWAMHDWKVRQAFPTFNETAYTHEDRNPFYDVKCGLSEAQRLELAEIKPGDLHPPVTFPKFVGFPREPETPVPADLQAPAEPPAPRAEAEGGAVPLGTVSRRSPGPSKRDTQGASGKARKAPGVSSSGDTKSGSASAPPPPIVDIKVNAVTGADLLAEIEPYLARTGLNRTDFSLRVFGYPGALSDLSGRRRQIPKPSTIEKVRRFIADNPDLRVEHKPKGEITGDQLADELDAFIAKHGLARTRVAKAALKHSSGIASLRRFKFPAARTIERVRSFLADPGPLEELKPGKRQPQSRRNPDAETIRRQRAINSASRAQAMKRIEDGLPVGDVKDVPVRVRCAQIKLEQELKDQARLACPVEQAKTVLRRRHAPVVSAETVGGPKGKFVVGRKTVSKSELLEMAEGMRP